MTKLLKSITVTLSFTLGGLVLESLGVEHNAYFALYGAAYMTIFFIATTKNEEIK